MYVDGIVWEMRFPCRFFLSDHTNMVLVQRCINNEVIGARILCQDKAEEGGVVVATVTDDTKRTVPVLGTGAKDRCILLDY